MLFKLFRALWLGVLSAACVLFILVRSETTSTAPPPAAPAWNEEQPASGNAENDASLSPMPASTDTLPIVRVEVPYPTGAAGDLQKAVTQTPIPIPKP